MARQTGTVEFFRGDRDIGFVRPDNGGKDLALHRSALRGGGTLVRGARVEFEVVDDPKGPRAENVNLLIEERLPDDD